MSDSESDGSSDSSFGENSYSVRAKQRQQRQKRMKNLYSQDFSTWLIVLEQYIEETKPNSLALKSLGLESKEAVSVLELIQNSQITDLSLYDNELRGGIASMAKILVKSNIKKLNLRCCFLDTREQLHLMNILKNSHITCLDVHETSSKFESDFSPSLTEMAINLTSSTVTVTEFANIGKVTNITNVDSSYNNFSHDAVKVLGDRFKHFKGSKVQCIRLHIELHEKCKVNACAALLEETKGSDIKMVHMSASNIEGEDLDVIGASIENSPITHFYIGCNMDTDDVKKFARHLKSTAITHLNLRGNIIGNEGAEILLEHLKETKVMALDLSFNYITTKGAKAIARYLRGTRLLSLKLEDNQIRNGGYHALAKGLENTFITEVCMARNREDRQLIIDRVQYKNRIAAHRLVCSFKKTVAQIQSNKFYHKEGSSNVLKSLDEHISFFKTLINKPASLNVLAQEASLSFTKEQLVTLLCEDFPRQLSVFIESQVEAKLPQEIAILKRVEELQLKPLIELLKRQEKNC